VLSFVPAAAFTLVRGQEHLIDYHFNKHAIRHQFCSICGCQSFALGRGPDGEETAAVNLRCVPGVDLDSLSIQKVDGASF
jgi:hypothetical protein